MAYLDPSEYVSYGLSADTPDAAVAAASAILEAHCKRGSLLVASYTERLRVNRTWGTAQLTYGPFGQLTAVQARCAADRDHRCEAMFPYARVFGVAGQWVPLDPASVTVDAASGELQLPVNLMGLRYSEVEVTYTAGLTTVPEAVKVACAQVVKNAQAIPGLNVKSSKLDTLQTEYFSDSLLDSQVVSLLRPFVAERLG